MKDELIIDDFSEEEIDMIRGFAKELLYNYVNNIAKLQWFEIHNAQTVRHYFPDDEEKQIDLFLAIYCVMITMEKNIGQMREADKKITEYYYGKVDGRLVLDKEIALIEERNKRQKELDAILNKVSTKMLGLVTDFKEILDKEEKEEEK